MRNIEDYFNSIFRGSKEPSLEAMHFFMKEYGNFQKEMKFIHIAGTNGKGSCVETMCNILEKQGYRVGKYMSPHLIKYNERIMVNHQEISDQEISDLIDELEPKMQQYNQQHTIPVTLFELETTIALLYFYRKKVDIAVLEVGCGGLYDCTNIIDNPLVSMIASIGYDHMGILGNTLEEIATQKAGIIKENSHTVVFSQSDEMNHIFQKICKEKNNVLKIVREEEIQNYHYDHSFQYFDYGDFSQLAIVLKGKKQVHNATLCIEAVHILNQLGIEISEKNMREGLKTVVHPGRMELLCQDPLIYYDGAHNVPAMENFHDMVEMYYGQEYSHRAYIVSILKRKDYPAMIKILLQDAKAEIYFTGGNDPEKYASGEELYQVASQYTSLNRLKVMSLERAIQEVKKKRYDVSFIVGSFYVYGSVIKELKGC